MTTDTMEQQTVAHAETEEHGAAASGNGRPRVVILGGGVAGLTAAYELRRCLCDRADMTLISDSDRFLLGLSLIWTPLG
jgi:NADPH-dependent 2,4-dienoyl-CoA reductase/sulfur reductase-like enzyme